MKILFISGFDTHPDEQHGSDLYTPFELHFRFSGDDIEFFRYKTTEPLDYVYRRLTDILDMKKHDYIICHSMGSGLAIKYIRDTGDKRRFVLCMPYIQVTSMVRFLSKVPLIRYLYLPKCCLIPNYNLFEGGNLLNDEITLISCDQVYSVIHDIFLSDDELVDTINTNNIHIIYATNEQVSPIDYAILSQIKADRLSYSKGKHMAFCNTHQMGDFFDVFSNVLKKDI